MTAYSVVGGEMWPKVELIEAVMIVLVTVQSIFFFTNPAHPHVEGATIKKN